MSGRCSFGAGRSEWRYNPATSNTFENEEYEIELCDSGRRLFDFDEHDPQLGLPHRKSRISVGLKRLRFGSMGEAIGNISLLTA